MYANAFKHILHLHIRQVDLYMRVLSFRICFRFSPSPDSGIHMKYAHIWKYVYILVCEYEFALLATAMTQQRIQAGNAKFPKRSTATKVNSNNNNDKSNVNVTDKVAMQMQYKGKARKQPKTQAMKNTPLHKFKNKKNYKN